MLIATMPIVLHPLLLFATMAGMKQSALLMAVLGGRTIKYFVMAQCAVRAPSLLWYFGVSESALREQAEGSCEPDVVSLDAASGGGVDAAPSGDSPETQACAVICCPPNVAAVCIQ